MAQGVKVNWGPFRLNLGFNVGTEVEYSDNVDNSETNPQEDISVRLVIGPTLSGGITLPFAGGQEFSLNLSANYTKTLTGEAARDDFGAPITASLTMPIDIGRWTVILADAFTFTNDPLESTVAVNVSEVEQWTNTASLSATRQMGKMAMTFAAQRVDKIVPDFPFQEETRYQISATPSYFLRENYSIFWRNTFGINELDDPLRRDSIGFSSEVGISGQIFQSLSGSLSIGYAISRLEAETNVEGGIFDGIFDGMKGVEYIGGVSSTMSLSYAQPLRPNTVHSISVFRSPGVTAALQDSDITETLGVGYSIAHRLSRGITLAPNVSWVNLKDVSGAGEKADIISVGIGLSRRFGRHLTISIVHRYQSRISNIEGSSYDINRVTVNVNYAF